MNERREGYSFLPYDRLVADRTYRKGLSLTPINAICHPGHTGVAIPLRRKSQC